MLDHLTSGNHEILIDGIAGKLQTNIAIPAEAHPTTVAVVCHPHPLFSGTMDNKVVTTLAKRFREQGLKSVRFNFRGVGKSAGTHDEGKGEQDDLIAVVDWLKSLGTTQIVLAGFSFGAGIALQVVAHDRSPLPITKLVTVAPAVNHFPSENLPPINIPWQVLIGDNDEVVDPKLVIDWCERQNPRPQVTRFPGVGHFFHGALLDLAKAVIYL